MAVQFTDNSAEAVAALDGAAMAWLYEAAGEMTSEIKRNARVDTGRTKGSFAYAVDGPKGEATVGSPLENAIWEEFGTGEYALYGDGRKGGWLVPGDRLTPKAKGRMQLREINGKEYYLTYGKKPQRTLWSAFNRLKAPLQALLEKRLKERMEG